MNVLTKLEKKIYETIKAEKRATPELLAKKVGTTKDTARVILVKLMKMGLVKRIARGLYEVVEDEGVQQE